MDKTKFEKEMKRIEKNNKGDTEALHVKMDNLMCKLLKELGYEDGVKVFENTNKWYA